MKGITITTKNSKTGARFEQFHGRKAVLEFGLRNAITFMHDVCESDILISVKREDYA
jgi:hypothetical protein